MTVSTLRQQCRNLQCLSIAYPKDIEEILGTAFEYAVERRDGFNELRPLFANQDISSFANLNYLEVHEIHGYVVKMRGGIIRALLQSPNLQTLSLSFNSETLVRLHKDDSATQYLDFLTNFVTEYKNDGGQPLKLSKLVLGLGILLWEDEEQAPASYLKNLTDLTSLEDVYVSNEGNDTALCFEEPDGVAWWTFTPSVCPNLRILRFHTMSDTFESWLQDLDPGYLSQIQMESSRGCELPKFDQILKGNGSTLSALTISYADDSVDYGEFTSLKFPTLQALSIGLWPITEDVEASFLNWIEGMTCLEQLSFREVDPHPERNSAYYEDLGFKIALRNNRLIYLTLGESAWRIWHDAEAGGESSCCLEKLDRFEEREIEASQKRSSHGIF
ncbi:hypothetical protein PVAG01_09642 [Phlyctema vagabunda]|uniref:F-box protein n=1 Tax=Phlyctema vagabunda TaxID=108571 RepID=A0ABR4P7Y1_9HELO